MDLISSERIDHGFCLIDVYRAPGDLNDSWDIVPMKEGKFPRFPDASYGPDAHDRYMDETILSQPVHVLQVYEVYDHNGHTYREITIYADGEVIASKRN